MGGGGVSLNMTINVYMALTFYDPQSDGLGPLFLRQFYRYFYDPMNIQVSFKDIQSVYYKEHLLVISYLYKFVKGHVLIDDFRSTLKLIKGKSIGFLYEYIDKKKTHLQPFVYNLEKYFLKQVVHRTANYLTVYNNETSLTLDSQNLRYTRENAIFLQNLKLELMNDRFHHSFIQCVIRQFLKKDGSAYVYNTLIPNMSFVNFVYNCILNLTYKNNLRIVYYFTPILPHICFGFNNRDKDKVESSYTLKICKHHYEPVNTYISKFKKKPRIYTDEYAYDRITYCTDHVTDVINIKLITYDSKGIYCHFVFWKKYSNLTFMYYVKDCNLIIRKYNRRQPLNKNKVDYGNDAKLLFIKQLYATTPLQTDRTSTVIPLDAAQPPQKCLDIIDNDPDGFWLHACDLCKIFKKQSFDQPLDG